MRAILIDAFNQRMEEIDLPIEVTAFQKRVRHLLQTENWGIVHCNDFVTVFFDEVALSKETPSFWVDFFEEWPVFGNLLCVGRNPITQEMEDLFDLYQFETFNVQWCDQSTTEYYRKMILERYDS
jgi:hypothetical protein